MAVANSRKELMMFWTVLVSLPGIIPCKLLVKKVQRRLVQKKKGMGVLNEKLRLAIVDNFKYNNDLERALSWAGYIIEDQWRNRAYDLINSSCVRIDDNMFHLFSRRSDNGESSQNGVEEAVASLVYLARVINNFDELGELGKHLENHFGERYQSFPIESILPDWLTNSVSANDDEKLEILQGIADDNGHKDAMQNLRSMWNRARGRTKQIPSSSCEGLESTESDKSTTSGYSVSETESESLDGSDTSNQVQNGDKSHDLKDGGRDTIPKEADDPSQTRNIYIVQPDTRVMFPPPVVNKFPDADKITAYFTWLKDANNREKANIRESYTSF